MREDEDYHPKSLGKPGENEIQAKQDLDRTQAGKN
jgi:hypothetical protein